MLKKEFDIHRAQGSPHPLMKAYGIDAVPFAHDRIDIWRDNFRGVQILHRPTNFVITGAVDDVWVRKKELGIRNNELGEQTTTTAEESRIKNQESDGELRIKNQELREQTTTTEESGIRNNELGEQTITTIEQSNNGTIEQLSNQTIEQLDKNQVRNADSKPHTPHNSLFVIPNSSFELIVVDYKATSTRAEITLDAEYRQAYKRQMEIYQWLLRRNGFPVSDTGYFVYANGDTDKAAFDGKLEFKVEIVPYTGDDRWVEETIVDAKQCLTGTIPAPSDACDYCAYREAVSKFEKQTGV